MDLHIEMPIKAMRKNGDCMEPFCFLGGLLGFVGKRSELW